MRVVRTLLRRFWNGNFGRLARRDVWLWEEPAKPATWTVVIRSGGSEHGSEKSWDFTDRAEAEAWLHKCLKARGDDWRELTP